MFLSGLNRWLTGGEHFSYSTLLHCMNGDAQWAWHVVTSKVLIFASYMLVAHYLYRRWRAIRKTKFGKALLYGSIVFVNCASVHLLNGIEFYWPARRLEAILSYSVAGINILFVLQLYRISALEKVLSINAVRRKMGSKNDAEGG